MVVSSLSHQLVNPSLLNSVHFESKADTYPVRDPANPETVLAHVPIQTVLDVKRSIQQSADALESWRDGTTAVERSSLLHKWSELIQENIQDIATIMTLESGKPLKESRGEVAYARSFLDYYAGEAVRPNGFLVPSPFSNGTTDGSRPRGQVMAVQQAVGVCALIAPWNFPAAMITRKLGPAIAAGCTAVAKPSELTPLTAIALHNLALQAGIPEAVFQLVTSDRDATPAVGKEFCTNPAVQKISFTGSTAVGKQLMEWSSGTVKRLSLELGGNAPFVVFDDADLEQAVDAAIASKFRNAGQTCVCADRFLVQSGIHDAFVERLVEKVRGTISNAVGPGMDESTEMGPLITKSAVESVYSKVKAAVKVDGANCLLGGAPLTSVGPPFFEPTILTNVKKSSDIWKTETFGPVAPIMSFETEEEALQIANDCSVGLASYFCTKDLSRAFRFSHK